MTPAAVSRIKELIERRPGAKALKVSTHGTIRKLSK
jgi:hypothetical protein